MAPAPAAEDATAQTTGRPLEPDAEAEKLRPVKRARVAVACTRCKTRKQKCDGIHPRCGNCKNISIACEYVTPAKALPYGKYEYVKALESKVAELETLLARECPGITESGKDHWEKVQPGNISEEANGIRTTTPGHSRTRSVVSEGKLAGTRSPEVRSSTSKYGGTRTDQEVTPHSARDLPFDNDGGYADGSANMTIGRMFGAMVKSQPPTFKVGIDLQHSQLSPKSMSLTSDQDYIDLGTGPSVMMRTTSHVAEQLFIGYAKHISTRWPILHSPEVRSLHERRLELDDPFEISTLSLVYAIGGRFLETTGELGNYFPERHYQAAIQHLDNLLQDHDFRAVQTLLLHAVYCLRAPRRPGAWTYIGLATRICIELGFHRRVSPTMKGGLETEMRRRIFWSCYCLDRQVSIILGRPFAISDRDIDADLPLDVDESATDESLEAYESRAEAEVPRVSTSMSCFIHIVRLRRIESSIQQSVYRVDRTACLPDSAINDFLEELEEWKENIPLDNRPGGDNETSSYDGNTYYMVYYYKCLRLLLYPQLSVKSVNSRILHKCAEASGGVCRAYQRLHRQTSVGFSLMALYSIFLAGLTLIYCIWMSPKDMFTISTNNDLNACSIVLYVITERWPGARKYRDAFESIKQCVMDSIADGEQLPRKPLVGLDAGLRATLEDVQNLHPEGREDFGRMISDMLDVTLNSAATSPAVNVNGNVNGNTNKSRKRNTGRTQNKWIPGAQMGIGIADHQAQAMYGSGSGYQYLGSSASHIMVQQRSIEGAAGSFETMGIGYADQGFGVAMPTTMDLLDGFDMENFLSNSNGFREIL